MLEEIKADEDLGQIPVVIMTSFRTHQDVLRSELMHVDAYVTKPVDLDKFVALVKEVRQFWHEKILLPVAP